MMENFQLKINRLMDFGITLKNKQEEIGLWNSLIKESTISKVYNDFY